MKKAKEFKPKRKKCCPKELQDKIEKAATLLNQLTEDAQKALKESTFEEVKDVRNND